MEEGFFVQVALADLVNVGVAVPVGFKTCACNIGSPSGKVAFHTVLLSQHGVLPW